MGERTFACHNNHTSVLKNPSVMDKAIAKEKAFGRIAGPFSEPPFPNMRFSPLGLVPKKEEGEFRVTHDLSFPPDQSINSHIPREHCTVKYESFDSFIDLVLAHGPKALIAKTDVETAFRLIPITEDYNLLGFIYKGLYYYDKCLPMGCSISCQLFERFSNALIWVLRERFRIKDVWHILDDFVFVGPSSSTACQEHLSSFLSLAKTLHLPIKESKTFNQATIMTVCGIEIDTIQMLMRLPDEKLERIKHMLHELRFRTKVTLRQLQSLIGVLNFSCTVVPPGRTFLRRLIDMT